MAHLGPRVSALLDGQLSREEEERAWAHVHGCHACRDLVEREGWVKTRLNGLALRDPAAPSSLKGALVDPLAGDDRPAGRSPGTQPGPARFRMVALGGGAVGAAFLGVLALTATGGPAQTPTTGTDRRPPVTSLNGTPTRTPGTAPASVRLGPLHGRAGVPGVRMDP